jgi:alkylation response protein AidB-like acyl-CoA dehydrogenase
MGGKILPVHAFMESLVALAEASTASNPNYGGLVALLKVAAGQALELAVRESQQIMGGLGYSRTGKGARIEQISRDVRVMVVGGGSEEILSELAFVQERRDLENADQGARSKL